MFLHLEIFSGNVTSSSSSSSWIGMEKSSEIRKGSHWLPVKALGLIWSSQLQHGGDSDPTCNSLYPGPAPPSPSTFWSLSISSEISSMQRQQQTRGVSVWGEAADTAAYTDFLSSLLARPWLWKIRDRLELGTCASRCIQKVTRNVHHHSSGGFLLISFSFHK